MTDETRSDGASSPHDGYVSPLAGRYASKKMQRIWSARHKFELWRKIWLAVAQAQHEVTKDWPHPKDGSKGKPPLVTAEQVEELRANLDVTDADIELAKKYEAELRHDVMSHVHAWGDRCPSARGIIHLGMTSQDVNDNCELHQLFDSITVMRKSLERLLIALGDQAAISKDIPTTGFTHYQSAQPVTVGRRMSQWAHDLAECWGSIQNTPQWVRNRGLRGATGTQASFYKLMNNDEDDLFRLESYFLLYFDDRFDDYSFMLTGQTYPRVFDTRVMGELANIAVVLHKMATDIRLLCNLGEVSEPFETKQIGSSAMPYKRNPMRCERVCGLTRFVWNLVPNAYDTAATQWLERTLDDSSNRRLVLPEAFLALDAALNIMHNVISGLVVHEKVIARNLERELPFLATEALMMAAVKLGKDRQDVHEAIRQHAMAAKHRMVEGDGVNDLVERLKAEPMLEGVDIDAELVPEKHIGLAVEQTERFLKAVIEPLRERHADEDEADEPEDLRV